jgi:hypothetical protein
VDARPAPVQEITGRSFETQHHSTPVSHETARELSLGRTGVDAQRVAAARGAGSIRVPRQGPGKVP